MKAEATGILMSMPNQYVLFCLNHCVRNQCDTKCNLWVQKQEFMVSDVYYSHVSPGIAQRVFIVMNMHSRACSQKKCQFIFRFKDLHFPSVLHTRNWPSARCKEESVPTVCEIINYLLTSSVTYHLWHSPLIVFWFCLYYTFIQQQ